MMIWMLMFSLYSVHNAQDLSEGSRNTRCELVKGAAIYSNARYIEEAGDVIGFELAFLDDKTALLFDYEGTPDAEPIPLNVSKNSGAWEGALRRKVIEYPSKREVTDTVAATVKGKLIGKGFQGAIQVGQGNSERVNLKRVRHLWGCK
jgi:hypothetical protein